MARRKNPPTSNAAYRSVHEEMKKSHYGKIISALKVLGSGIYEEVARQACMEKNQVSRRLKEMEKLELVWKPGATKPTRAGRAAYVYQLNGDAQVKTDHALNEIVKSEKPAEVSKSKSKPAYIQNNLF